MPYKFLVDTHYNLCIKCKGCEAICKNNNDLPKGVFRIKVITINEGRPGQLNIPLMCMHCNDPPCMKVCPVKAIYKREDGIVLVDKDKCIGCGYCAFACPFGAPQFPEGGAFGSKGKMDKCTYCVLPFEPERDEKGNVIYRDPVPRCALVCPCETILAGEMSEITQKLRERVGALTASKIESLFLF